jgi:hypothetical protein
MRHKARKRLCVYFGGIFTVLFSICTFAQPQLNRITPSEPSDLLSPVETIHSPSPQVSPSKIQLQASINPALIRIYKRPSIPFKPFTYADFKNPQTGQILTPDQIITLTHITPQKKIRADQFINELNRLEREFNAYGYSHRDRAPVTIGEFAIRQDLLKSQAASIKAKTSAFTSNVAPRSLDAEALTRIHNENLAQAEIVKRQLPKMQMQKATTTTPFTPIHSEKHWNESYGDPDFFAVHQTIDLVLDGKQDRLTAEANNELGLTIFNKKITIVGGSASLNAPGPVATDSNVGGVFYVKYLNEKKVQVTIGPTSNKPYEGWVPILQVPEFITNVPVPASGMIVEIGYAGTIGVNYAISVTPLAINCRIIPVANVSMTTRVGGGFIAEVGVEGKMLFLFDRATLVGELTARPIVETVSSGQAAVVRPQETLKPNYTFKAVNSCFDTFTALKGSFSLYFKIDLIFWEKMWKTVIYESAPFEHTGYLFDETLTQNKYVSK